MEDKADLELDMDFDKAFSHNKQGGFANGARGFGGPRGGFLSSRGYGRGPRGPRGPSGPSRGFGRQGGYGGYGGYGSVSGSVSNAGYGQSG